MIRSKAELYDTLACDSRNYQSVARGFIAKIKAYLLSNPISEQRYIWQYIKTMRWVEYLGYKKKNNFLLIPIYLLYLHRLRRYARITGIQLPPIYVVRA